MEVLNHTLEELKAKASFYQNEVELGALDNCPFIVEVGALTVGTDETGKVITQNINHPTQYTQKAVDEIFSMRFKSDNDENVIPKIYGRAEWYRNRLDDITETIKLLETNFSEVK